MDIAPPFDVVRWIERNRAQLRPPVGNKLLFEHSELIVMAVGGPNRRKDFHHDPGEELFYQVQGDIVLRTIQDGRFVDVPIREGEIFLLPAEVPHSSWSNAAAGPTSSTASLGTANNAATACC
jgi:3-hydroxyanthranilate 3,4-dioxygenase